MGSVVPVVPVRRPVLEGACSAALRSRRARFASCLRPLYGAGGYYLGRQAPRCADTKARFVEHVPFTKAWVRIAELPLQS